jgi:hypothetical protein
VEHRPVDPRDIQWEIASPRYRVYFWQSLASGGYSSDEFELTGAVDVKHVLRWAEDRAAGRTYVVYALVELGSSPGLVQLAGVDPTGTSEVMDG